MFVCGLCSKNSEPGEKAFRVVTETRPAAYAFRKDAHGDGKDDPGGKGIEIAKEVLAHKDCAERFQSETELGGTVQSSSGSGKRNTAEAQKETNRRFR